MKSYTHMVFLASFSSYVVIRALYTSSRAYNESGTEDLSIVYIHPRLKAQQAQEWEMNGPT